jgi:FAD/FMN-containing dehydrogenase
MKVSKSHKQLVIEAFQYTRKKIKRHKNQACFSVFSHLASPTDRDYDSLASLMRHGGSVIKADPNELDKFNKDWTGHYKGISNTIVLPTCVEEVSSILAYCNERSIGIVPQGGNTGLVGGSVPVSDELVLSLSLMNKIYPSLNDSNDKDDSSVLTCDAGCILQSLQTYASERNHLIPIDIGSKGSCMIGGNISTNAGGQYFNRFGSLHANVVGLEVVLANGRVLDLLNTNRKDNTGYHLKHLFIGAEGTLGVVTKVNLYCPSKPSARNVALVACETFQHVIDSLKLAKAQLGEILAAFEFMDQNALDLSESSVPFGRPNGNKNYPFCILIETQGSNMEHDSSKLLKFLDQSIQEGVVIDGILAQDGKQIESM